jgi:predicted enzyme related to lactoylglutathione lyase
MIMKRVTGIGGIFFKARDPKALTAWYKQHLGMDIQSWGGIAFESHDPAQPQQVNQTVWSVFASDNNFGSSSAPFMINYRVDDLAALLAALRAEGCAVEDKTDDSEYGKFGWVMDPEGNRIELWQPPAA